MSAVDSQLQLDGHVVSLLLMHTYLCGVSLSEADPAAARILLVYLVRAVESVRVPQLRVADA